MTTQMRVVAGELNTSQYVQEVELYGPDGTPFVPGEGGGDEVVLPPTMTAAEAEAGTETADRLISPAVLNAEIARQIAAIPPPVAE